MRHLPNNLDKPIPHLLARLALGAPRWIIGMAGLPGGGKSTLAARLADEINARAGAGTMVALGMDGFHLTKAQLRQMPNPEEAFARRGAPWTFDPVALHQRLHRLRHAAGHEAVPWPGFAHDVGDPVEGECVVPPSTRLILIEGLYLLLDDADWQPICDSFDERWYLDTSMAVAMKRLAQRHMHAWGWTREAAEARIAASDRLNAQVVYASRSRAEWWVR
jgi:pantothenate kinase